MLIIHLANHKLYKNIISNLTILFYIFGYLNRVNYILINFTNYKYNNKKSKILYKNTINEFHSFREKFTNIL
jgi:hypothetical protein